MIVPDETKDQLAQEYSMTMVSFRSLEAEDQSVIMGWLDAEPRGVMNTLDTIVEKSREAADTAKEQVSRTPVLDAYMDESKLLSREYAAVRARAEWTSFLKHVDEACGSDADLSGALEELRRILW